MTSIIVTNPPTLKPQSSVAELKARLDWGEPALTIIDVRDHADFNISRIQGAVSMPSDVLIETVVRSLEQERDIYVYGDSTEMTKEAVNQLRDAGYQHVAELSGGLEAWRAAKYPVEGL